MAKAVFRKLMDTAGLPLGGTYEERIAAVGYAVREQHAAFGAEKEWDVWPIGTGPDTVLVQLDDQFWVVAYTTDEEGVQLDLASMREVRVESQVVPVRQAIEYYRSGAIAATLDFSRAEEIDKWLEAPLTVDLGGKADRFRRHGPIRKAATDRRLVYGIVLEPDSEDAQGDIIRADEIEAACHDFNRRLALQRAVMGEQHERVAAVEVLQSYIAPVDFELEGQTVTKGSWVLVSFVGDDRMWEEVKSGELTGYSIGGIGERVEAA